MRKIVLIFFISLVLFSSKSYASGAWDSVENIQIDDPDNVVINQSLLMKKRVQNVEATDISVVNGVVGSSIRVWAVMMSHKNGTTDINYDVFFDSGGSGDEIYSGSLPINSVGPNFSFGGHYLQGPSGEGIDMDVEGGVGQFRIVIYYTLEVD